MGRAIAIWPLVVLGAACVLASGCATSGGPRSRADAPPAPSSPPATSSPPSSTSPAAPPTITGSRTVPERRPERPAGSLSGKASWYGEAHHGLKTASGEVYDMHKMTAAHRTLPFGTRIRVTHVDSGRSVVVRVNDRGPHVTDRIVDLSHAAAQALGARAVGVFAVSIEVLDDAPTGSPSTPVSR